MILGHTRIRGEYVGTNPVVTCWPGYRHMESAGARLQELMQEVDAASAPSMRECVGKNNMRCA